jgi:hypothetical protein
MDVMSAVTTAQGENMTSIPEETTGTPATAKAAQPKATRKANVAQRARHDAPGKAKSGKKATPAKKAPKGAKKAKTAKQADGARPGSKTAKLLELLRRPGGATAKELMKATGWQPHSVRGFLSGTVGKKMGLTIESAKRDDGERVYSLPK